MGYPARQSSRAGREEGALNTQEPGADHVVAVAAAHVEQPSIHLWDQLGAETLLQLILRLRLFLPVGHACVAVDRRRRCDMLLRLLGLA